jgi:hypothetical protein
LTFDKIHQRWWNVEAVQTAALGNLIGKFLARVARPTFSRVESDNAGRVRILTVDEVGDERAPVGTLFISLAPSSAEPCAEVIEHQVNISIIGRGRGKEGITQTPGKRS